MNAWATLGAAALHASLLGYLFLGEAPKLKVDLKRPPVRIRAAVRPTPPPPSLPEPMVVAEPTRAVPEIAPALQRQARPAPRKEPKKVAAARVEPPPTPVPSPSQPPAAPPSVASAEQPRPRKFTVALGATVGAGGIAVPVSQSGSTWGLGGGQGVDPDEDDSPSGPLGSAGAGRGSGTGSGARRADVSELTTRPRLVSQPAEEEMRALYPSTARRDGLEGDVSLRILVSTSGEVMKVKVVKGAGNGFEEAASAIVKRFRFQAAEVGGQPVEVWIPWTYKFRLEG